MKRMIFAALVACAPMTAHAQRAAPPEPTETPDWSAARAQAERELVREFFDPDSAKITWVKGFHWNQIKQGLIMPRRHWGWIACVEVNGKNRYGGYVGANRYWVRINADGTVVTESPTRGEAGGTYSTCQDDKPVALQPELMPRTQAVAGTNSLADELAKLADLRAKGILTDAEFETQKARLLNQ